MISFTDKLVVSKETDNCWIVERSFIYYIGKEYGKNYVKVPAGFRTDFASVPRIFWIIIPPDGKYTQAAVLHDYLYYKKLFKRKKCDKIFLEAMGILGVPAWKRRIMFRAVRLFGWIPWNTN